MEKGCCYYIVDVRGKEVHSFSAGVLFTDIMFSISTGALIMSKLCGNGVPYDIYTYGQKKSILHNGYKLKCNGTISIVHDSKGHPFFKIETTATDMFNREISIVEIIPINNYTLEFIVEDLFVAIFKRFYEISSTGNGRFDNLCLKIEQFCTKWTHILDTAPHIDKKQYDQFKKESKEIDRIWHRIGKYPELEGNRHEYFHYIVKALAKLHYRVPRKLFESHPHYFYKQKRKTLKQKCKHK